MFKKYYHIYYKFYTKNSPIDCNGDGDAGFGMPLGYSQNDFVKGAREYLVNEVALQIKKDHNIDIKKEDIKIVIKNICRL